jgi:hypothetical protein
VIERLPARVRTPAVARAVTSPSAVLLAGAGMSAAILGGLPLAAAAVVGGLAWAARVALAVPRVPADERVDPRRVREPWRHFVRDALQARGRFERTVARTRPGPLRDRLAGLGRRLDDGVTECWRIACQGDALDSALDQLDAGAIEAELADVQARRQGAPADARGSLERAEQAIRAQLSSVQRIDRVSADARNRLLVLNAQLDEAVARAVELSLRAGDTSELSPLSDDVDSLVSELESLRQALEETVPSGGLAP